MERTRRTPPTLRAAPLAVAVALALGALQAPAPEAAERGAVSAGAPPASEARSKKTGKRKPREIVVVGSRAKPEAEPPGTTTPRLAAPSGVSGTPPSIAPLDIKKLNLKSPKNRPPRLPYFTQLGPTPVAKVPMQWVSCGPNCTEWKLASSHGNLKIKGWIDMYCPAGTTLTYLAYRPQGGQETVVKQGQTKIQGYSKTVWPKPFTAAQLEKACQKALKGYPGSNPPVVKKLITTTVYARGRCSDSATVHERGYPVTLKLQCVPPPTPG